jgi:hypothetical protein
MIAKITYFIILGKPLVFYLGIISLLLFISAATVAILNTKGMHKIPFVWHPRLAITAIVVALTHALLIILATL